MEKEECPEGNDNLEQYKIWYLHRLILFSRKMYLPHFFHYPFIGIVHEIGASEVYVIFVQIFWISAIYIWQTDAVEVGPQSSYGVLHNVCSELRARGPKQKDSYYTVGLP